MPNRCALTALTPTAPLSPKECRLISQLAYERFGVDLRQGKEALIESRLAKKIRHSPFQNFEQYYRYVVADPSGDALVDLIDALTTNYTSFLREPAHFKYLKQFLLPQWKHRGKIEIWSAACSSGEEPYSLAFLLLEELGPQARSRIHILASDISRKALGTAERAVYPSEALTGCPKRWLQKYCQRGLNQWRGYFRVKVEVRELVEFRRLNLIEPIQLRGQFPIIFCRNVMIYFDRPTRLKVVQQLVRHLEPGGYLMTGHAETLHGLELPLTPLQPAVYRKGTGSYFAPEG